MKGDGMSTKGAGWGIGVGSLFVGGGFALAGHFIQAGIADSAIKKEYTAIAISILANSEIDDGELVDWAQRLLDKVAPVSMGSKAAEVVRTDREVTSSAFLAYSNILSSRALPETMLAQQGEPLRLQPVITAQQIVLGASVGPPEQSFPFPGAPLFYEGEGPWGGEIGELGRLDIGEGAYRVIPELMADEEGRATTSWIILPYEHVD